MSHPRLVLIHSIATKSRLDANRVRYLSRRDAIAAVSFYTHIHLYPWRVAGALIAAMPPLHQLNGKIIDNRLSCFHSWVPRRATNSTSLIDSHWAWRAYPVSLLCFVLFDQDGSTKERSDFEMISRRRLDERTRWINATASTCPLYFWLLILKPTQWSVSIPWVCGQIRPCVDWIDARFDCQKTMRSNYKPVKPVLFSPMFQSLTTCGNSSSCWHCTIW